MDHVRLVQYLGEAEDDLASAARAIFRQQEVILDLERDGHEAREAKRLLATFEEVLKLHLSNRNTRRKLFADG